MTAMEQINEISNDITQKLSETRVGSNARRFLLIKKKILDDALENIANECKVNTYEYALYNLCDKRDALAIKILNKERRPTQDDEDVKELKNIRMDLEWIRRTKLQGVKTTDIRNAF